MQVWLLPLQVSGAADKAGKTAQKASKKTPFGYMHMGDLAFDLPGSNVSKDDLPNNVKPGDAAGLPKGPTAKPPSGPSLPKVMQSYLCQSWVFGFPTSTATYGGPLT